MLKLKFSLDPKDAKQMLALSRFAGTLADVAETEVKQATKEQSEALLKKTLVVASNGLEAEAKVIELAPSGRTVENQASEEANGNTEAVEPPKRKRRSKAEIEADEAAAKEEKPARETSGEEAESEAAEVEEEEESDDAPAAKIEKPAKTAARGSITLDDVRRAVAEKKGTAENFQKMKDRLKEAYGVETTPKLDPKYYAEFYDFVNGLK